MKAKYFWIKERDNPQFKKSYYIAYGAIPKKKALAYENTNYGYNTMLQFNTEKEYLAKIEELKAAGFNVTIQECKS